MSKRKNRPRVASPPVKTSKELLTALASVPSFSREVYDTLQAQLLQGRSVDGDDVAKVLGHNRTAVYASIMRLLAAGLIYTEDGQREGRQIVLLQTHEQTNDITR